VDDRASSSASPFSLELIAQEMAIAQRINHSSEVEIEEFYELMFTWTGIRK
jgi:hypothetical protein